ncbi:hypothetical protein [Streptomyces sp. MK5]|uniref:hypothetical protein n=1 Tax=Streptomyces sp. MK5 TaxID=3064253 RepID=UPI002741C6C0|nr:hypothetical protein [Streptomyces sp. MK5]
MNEERFYLYPMKRVAAVLQRLLDSKGTFHGLLSRFMRWLQHGGYESETLAAHSAALSQGKWLIFVPVRGKNEARRTVDILRSHGGSEIFHFRRWAVQFFPRKID